MTGLAHACICHATFFSDAASEGSERRNCGKTTEAS